MPTFLRTVLFFAGCVLICFWRLVHFTYFTTDDAIDSSASAFEQLCALVRSLSTQNKTGPAKRAFALAMAKRPREQDAHAWFRLATLSTRARDWHSAAAYLSKSASLNPSNAETWVSLLKTQKRLRHLDAALSTYHAAISHNVSHPYLPGSAKLILAGKGMKKKAGDILQKAVEMGTLVHPAQHPMIFIRGLRSVPMWEPSLFRAARELESNFVAIQREFVRQFSQGMPLTKEGGNLTREGRWNKFELYSHGFKSPTPNLVLRRNCERLPFLCKVLEGLPEATSMVFGSIYLSFMTPGTRVRPHVGPHNIRLRIHLALQVPRRVKMRVHNRIHEWQEGKCIVFDDSFEHEVWHEGNETRVVLVVDIWHPDLDDEGRIGTLRQFGSNLAYQQMYYIYRKMHARENTWFV
jgi:aspartate beta-hydroxylase